MVDLWGFVEEGACSFADFAAELNARVRAEDEAPVLLGYSMGGRLALHALLEDGVPWRAGVIVSAHPGIRDPEERVMRMAKDAEWATGAFSGSWQKFLADWNSQGVLEGEMVGRLGDRNRLEPRRVAVARGFMEWSLGKQEDLGPRLGEIECPVLWLTGERDLSAPWLCPGPQKKRGRREKRGERREPSQEPPQKQRLKQRFSRA